jgi:hypothetical protein
MNAPTYDIYSGHIHGHSVCVESVQGMGNAYELMTKLAAKCPGAYFIRCAKTNIVRGSIDTSGGSRPRSLQFAYDPR